MYSREQKSIPISPQVRAALGIDDDVEEMTPPALMKAILKAPVDLFCNGGIGTYVKAETESDADVGDRANDAVRVNGNQVRAKVIGEGGNLGVTQRGRIEFDLAGGRINTDALDNSAGVDCSDHEVNIKILIDSLVTAGKVSAEERTALLLSMTDEVGRLVLADNEDQNDLMGTSRANAASLLPVHARQIKDFVAERGLNRELEALPSEKEIRRRTEAGIGLTSPELATLMAHVKLALKDELLASDLPDQEVFAARLPRYFPAGCATSSAPRSVPISCAARSSPRCWSTIWSTPAESPTPTGSPRTPASVRSTRCAAMSPPMRSSASSEVWRGSEPRRAGVR